MNLKIFPAIISLLAFTGVVLQYYLFDITFENYLSYFTVQSNSLIAISLAVYVLVPDSYLGQKLGGNFWLSGMALYIIIVALVYNVLLRWGWHTEGWQILADNLVHAVVPVLYIIFWYERVPKRAIKSRHVYLWLMYPAIYLVYTLLRGWYVQWYPYPFLNVLNLGYTRVIINSVVIGFLYLGIGFALMAINKCCTANK